MNKKGQALVEFIIILPVLIMIFMSIVDMGNLFYKKYQLENELDYIADLYINDKKAEINTYVNDNQFIINYETNLSKTTINLKKKVEIVTPGLKRIFKDPYYIEVKRVVYDE